MDEYRFQSRLWRVCCRLLGPAIRHHMGLDMDPLPADGPCLIICNHVTNLDPVMLGLASPKKMITYVASENILRLHPRLRGLLYGAFGPIARRKGASGAQTALASLRALRAGKSVCIFAEGETSWNGLTGQIHSGTAQLVKASGVPLVTYRIHGGYFTFPRWSSSLRRGRVRGILAGVHPPEELRALSGGEIDEMISREISEDAFALQKEERIPYRSKKRAECVSSLLFLCPSCHGIGTLRGSGNRILCSCGLAVSLDACLLPEGDAPFADLTAWDRWQMRSLGEMLEKDPGMILREGRADLRAWEILPDGEPVLRAVGDLWTDGACLAVGKSRFPLSHIRDMVLLQKKKLAFTCGDRYFEVHAPDPLCLRKYLFRWQTRPREND